MINPNYNASTGGFKRSNNLALPAAVVQAMYADYSSGLSLREVGRRHGGRDGRTIGDIFNLRGLAMRQNENQWNRHRADGSFEAMPPLTEKEITAIIAGMTRLSIPEPLKLDWRKWDMARRGEFIKRARKHLETKHGIVYAPSSKHSKNVMPFDYCTPAARLIVEKMNAGKNSQQCPAKLKLVSQGVIYKGELYYWSSGTGYQKTMGAYDPMLGRPQLHRVIYEEAHGPIPAGMTVIHKDGNKNNFDPKNLALRSMADCARQNAWHRRPEKHPGLAKWIGCKAWETKNQQNLLRQRGLVSALLMPKKDAGLLAALKRRKQDETD